MIRIRLLCGVLPALLLPACQSYEPAPVDVKAHLRQFRERLPDLPVVRPASLGVQDGPVLRHLSLQDARLIALLWNQELRLARQRARVAEAAAEVAGRMADPEVEADLARILESTAAHPWLGGVSLAFTLPLSGRLGLEQELAASEHWRELIAARAAEARVLAQVEVAWVRLRTAERRRQLTQQLDDELAALERAAQALREAEQFTAIDLRRIQVARLDRQAERLDAATAAIDAAHELHGLLGLPPGTPVLPALETAIDPWRPAGERWDALLEGPGLAVLQEEHKRSEKAFELAICKQWPELRIAPGFGEEDGQPRALLGLSFPLPLWNGNVREIAETRAARDLAAEGLRCGVEQGWHALSRAERRLDSARAQRRLLEGELLPLARAQLADVHRLLELGELDRTRTLDAILSSHDAQRRVLESELEEAEAIGQLNELFWPVLVPAKEKS